MAESQWSKTARLESAIRDGLTPRKDGKPWDARIFNPFNTSRIERKGMTVEDVRRLAATCKKVRQVKASEVKLKNATS
jgi:hypothetical protein